MQHTRQNNTLSLGVAIFNDKRQIPRLPDNTVQNPRKGKGIDEVQVQRGKTSIFGILASASFEIYAVYVSRRL